jgi:hypothetical protein
MFHVATLSEDDSDAAPLLPEASPRTQRKFDTVRQEDVNFATCFVLKTFTLYSINVKQPVRIKKSYKKCFQKGGFSAALLQFFLVDTFST